MKSWLTWTERRLLRLFRKLSYRQKFHLKAEMFSFHSNYFVYRELKTAPEKLSFCFKCPDTGTVRILGNILYIAAALRVKTYWKLTFFFQIIQHLQFIRIARFKVILFGYFPVLHLGRFSQEIERTSSGYLHPSLRHIAIKTPAKVTSHVVILSRLSRFLLDASLPFRRLICFCLLVCYCQYLLQLPKTTQRLCNTLRRTTDF